MKIGCGTVLFRKYELERCLAAIREIGYEYFETQATVPWCPHVDVTKDDPEALVKLKNKYGFREITGLWSCAGNLMRSENCVERNIRCIEWAAAAGIPVLHLGDGHKPDEMSEEDACARLSENLCAILEAGERHGVTVAIEPHGTFSLTKAGLCRILSVGTPKTLGVNYDACNIFRSAYVESGSASSGWHVAEGKEDELEVLQAVTDRVVHCHAKDVNSQGKCVALGEGLVNVKGCIKHLIASGYQGVVSVETEGDDDFESAVALAKKSYDYLLALVKGEA